MCVVISVVLGEQLLGRGVTKSDVFHFVNGVFWWARSQVWDSRLACCRYLPRLSFSMGFSIQIKHHPLCWSVWMQPAWPAGSLPLCSLMQYSDGTRSCLTSPVWVGTCSHQNQGHFWACSYAWLLSVVFNLLMQSLFCALSRCYFSCFFLFLHGLSYLGFFWLFWLGM